MKKKLLLAVLTIIFASCLVLTACDMSPNDPNKGWGSVFTYETAYAEAQSLGYTGSLQDFIDSIKGKDGIDGKDGTDGIGIKSVAVNEQGNLIVTLTNDSVVDCGSVRGPKGDRGEKGDQGIQGEKGDKGEQGVSIVSTAFDKNGNTVITYSNDTTQTIEHKWKVCYTLVQANCITDGKVLYECEDCSLVRVVTVAKSGHTEGEWTTDTQPTCTATGSKHQVCSVCGDTINTETINANGHDYNDQVVDPTCTTQGYTLHTCSVCRDNYQDTVVPANGVHNFQESNVCEYCEQDIADVAVDSYDMSKTTDDNVSAYVVPRANGKYDAYIKGTGATKDYEASTTPFRADGYSDKIVNAYIQKGVTTIGGWTFYYCSNLTSVTFEENSKLTTIGGWTFYYCTSLESITIPSSVTTIGEGAFYGCTSLESITIPSSVTTIGWGAFGDCTSLANITIEGVPQIGGKAFNGTAAYNNTSNWENKVLYIDNCLIDAKTTIESCTIKDGTKVIAASAFENRTSLESVTIPSSVTTIGEQAFYHCTKLANITVDETNQAYKSIDGNLYSKDGTILIQYAIGKTATSFTVPSSVTTIGGHAFCWCESLESITIPSSVTTIGGHAFFWCRSLESITIPSSVTTIGEQAFYYCTKLANITVDETNQAYKSIDGNLYSKDGTILIQYAIGKTAASFTVPSSVTAIGEWAFEYCKSLESVTIPSSVTTIGEGAFYGCSKLASVMFEENSKLTTIAGWAFSECYSLESVTIPSSVTTIGEWAFSGCTKLANITVDETNQAYKSIDGNLYSKDGTILIKYAIGKTATSFTIPSSVTTIGNEAFCKCSNLTSVTFEENSKLTTIGASAFSGCSKLANITFEDPNGWYCTRTEGATSGTNLTLTDPTENATYLRDWNMYSNYYWYKSTNE